VPELQAQPHRLDAGAAAQQLPQNVGAKGIGVLDQLARLLESLTYADLVQDLE
jgi:hypothetical protein